MTRKLRTPFVNLMRAGTKARARFETTGASKRSPMRRGMTLTALVIGGIADELL
jgi:hypothetical protein